MNNDTKSIEERAGRAIYEPTDGHPLKACEVVAFARGYELGATEQKTIDEAIRLKKCDDMTEAEYNREVAFIDWFYENSGGAITHSDAIEWARKTTIAEACEWLEERVQCGVHPQRAHGFAEEFRKAMEE